MPANREVPATVEQLDIDLAGDVMLILGDSGDQTRVRVSSKVLSLASPVLAAMFSSKYSEGYNLAEKGYLEVTLREDNPQAMIFLSKALHFQQTLSQVSLPLLEELAILCDKYDASLALGPLSKIWLSSDIGSVDSEDRHLKILRISYLLGNQSSSWKSSLRSEA